ncbi:glycoside hydrolase family 30 protein [Hujiaoplasma nucleasis]|nr:glycoside hydrolase family 30 protein [Hujiaoplasma nucleasis]
MIKHIQSSKYKNGFQRLMTKTDQKPNVEISFNKDVKYQSIIGFGGAFTEAAAYTFYQMPVDKQKILLEAYFNQNTGLSYNLGRVSIHSCDFSLNNYTYVDDFDEGLKSFNIKRDLSYVIPMIHQAEMVRNDRINILASPWSPPAWMKTNNDMNHGGSLLDEYKDAWANYYLKFLEAYTQHDVSIFALTVQNEPAAKQIWDSCLYTKEEERDFVKDYLGPKLAQSNFSDVKLLIWDHNRDIMVERAKAVYEDKKASQYVWGLGFHWYVSEAFENLKKVHDMFPNKHLLFTEGTIEGGVHLHQFETGERYARNMIGDFSHYCEGYIDWNLLLNEEGGPNHVGNYCDAPIIYDRNNDELIFNSSFYAIGHFSKYLMVGAKRIESKTNHNDLKQVAFLNPNGDIVFIIQNETEEIHVVHFEDNENNFLIEARSISTIILESE